MSRPLPAQDRDSAPFWAALTRHELPLQQCDACAAWRWPPREMCGRCGGLTWSWQQASGRGTIASWIVNQHTFDPAFTSPYVVVAVRLAEQEDIVMPGAYGGAPDGSDLSIGMPVVAGFEDVAGEDGARVTLLRWRPA